MCSFACICVCAPYICQVPLKDKGGNQTSKQLSHLYSPHSSLVTLCNSSIFSWGESKIKQTTCGPRRHPRICKPHMLLRVVRIPTRTRLLLKLNPDYNGYFICPKKSIWGAREMVQWLKTLAILLNNPCLIPRTLGGSQPTITLVLG